jgi:NADH-quinone oxidoreductase subunit A
VTHEIEQFGQLLLFLVGSIAFVLVTLGVARLLSPHRPNPEKNAAYECGEDPAGSSWGQFNPRFYVVALIFMLFEAELLFLFPWSVVFAGKMPGEPAFLWRWHSGVSMLLFVALLAIGLAFVWVKGYLDWVKPALPAAQKQPSLGNNPHLEAYLNYRPPVANRPQTDETPLTNLN